MKEKRRRKCLDDVREALRCWDPIGVLSGEAGSCDDEYDTYATSVLSALEKGADANRIAIHLAQIRSVSMCLGSKHPTEREKELGEKLTVWRDGNYVKKPNF